MTRRVQLRVRLDERRVGHLVIIEWLDELRARDRGGTLSDAVVDALSCYLRRVGPPSRPATSEPRSGVTAGEALPSVDAPVLNSQPCTEDRQLGLADAAARMFADD